MVGDGRAADDESMTTRTFRSRLRTLLFAVIALAVVIATGGARLWSRASVDTRGMVSFDQPVPIPPLAESHVDDAGRRVFDLELRAGSHRFRPGAPAPTWGINQDHD